jgi:hypothetical protein
LEMLEEQQEMWKCGYWTSKVFLLPQDYYNQQAYVRST